MKCFQFAVSLMFVALLGLLACAEAQDAPTTPKETKQTDSTTTQPKVDKDGLIRLSPADEIWIDTVKKRVILKGKVCLTAGQLEMLITLTGGKEHESIVAVNTKAQFVHAALLAVGAEKGTPVSFRPEYKPPTGSEVEVLIEWVDSNGKTQQVRGQDWVRKISTQRAMDLKFVFAGSGFSKEENGKLNYLAEEGDLICVSNFPSATCDVPAKSGSGAKDLMFEAFSERIPPRETPVTVYLVPKPTPKDKPEK